MNLEIGLLVCRVNIGHVIDIPMNIEIDLLYITFDTIRVHFGGTETARSWIGYMEGAVESGMRTGLEVLKVVKPESLTAEDFKNIDGNTVTDSEGSCNIM